MSSPSPDRDFDSLKAALEASFEKQLRPAFEAFAERLTDLAERLDLFTSKLSALSERQAVQEERLNARHGCQDPTLCIRLEERQRELEKQLERRIASVDQELDRLATSVTDLNKIKDGMQGARWATGVWIGVGVALGGAFAWLIEHLPQVTPLLQR